MDPTDRALLLAIVALPACAPAVDEPSGDEDDDGMPGDPERLETSCEAFFAVYVECDSAPTGTSGDYDPAEYCKYYSEYLEAYGPGCAGAQEDVFSCLATLDCAGLADPFAGPCRDNYAAAHEVCPQVFSFCTGGSGTFGATSCEVESDGCLDGKTYAVGCGQRASGDGFGCTCTIDGSPSGTFEVADGCNDETIAGLAHMHCGFPEGVP